jgi:hypothetical protein
LHEVGQAFGTPHTTGIMARGYAQYWPRKLLSRTAYCAHTKQPGPTVLDGETSNDARWYRSDALSFKVLPPLKPPTDPVLSREAIVAEPNVQVAFEDGQEEFLILVISSPAQIVHIKFCKIEEAELIIATPISKSQVTSDELKARFERSNHLELGVLGMNDKSRVIGNVWRLFSGVSFISSSWIFYCPTEKIPAADTRANVTGKFH